MAEKKSKYKVKRIKRNTKRNTKRNSSAPPTSARKRKRKPGRPKGTTKDNIKITTKEQTFANLIIENGFKNTKKKMTQTECYRIAYQNYKMKDSSAQVTASNLLKKPKIKNYIQLLKKKAAGKVQITTIRVLKGLLRIAEFDIRNLFDKRGRPIPIHKLDKETALGLSSCEFVPVSRRTPSGRLKFYYVPKKIKNEARKPAWELLGHTLNMFTGLNTQETPQEFVNEVRGFADSVAMGVPGGKI